MNEPGDRHQDIVIVSDLHMAAGRDPASGIVSPYEDFHQDAAFANFLNDLRDRVLAEQRDVRLIILGDLCDFLHVVISESQGKDAHASGLAVTLAKLDRIAAGHPVVFEALGQFVAAGFGVDIVPGNHDIEFICPQVQERFIHLVAQAGGGTSSQIAIRFHPWIYYVAGTLYAEHGHQYHDINSFRTLLSFDCAHGPATSELPFGSLFDEHLFGLLDSIGRDRRTTSLPRSVARVIRQNPSLLVTRLPYHLRYIAVVARRLTATRTRKSAARRAEYRERVLQRYAADVGLSAEALHRIDQLSEAAARNMYRRILTLLTGNVLQRVLRTLTMTTSTQSRRRPGVPLSPGQRHYLLRAAADIHAILRETGESVPYYVFGHSHAASRHSLIDGAETPRYINCGAWPGIASDAGESRGESHSLTFVHISCGGRDAVDARLMRWDDTLRLASPLS